MLGGFRSFRWAKRPRTGPDGMARAGPPPHHQVRWAAEADRPPSGRIPPPVGNATTRRFLPASSPAPHLPPASSPSARTEEAAEASRPARTAHPLSANRSPHLRVALPSAGRSHPHRRRLLRKEQPPCQPRIRAISRSFAPPPPGDARFSPGDRHLRPRILPTPTRTPPPTLPPTAPEQAPMHFIAPNSAPEQSADHESPPLDSIGAVSPEPIVLSRLLPTRNPGHLASPRQLRRSI